MKEQILINGRHGFIASHLAEALEPQVDVIAGNRFGYVPIVDGIYDLASYGNLYHQTDVMKMYEANLFRVLDLLGNAEKYDYKFCILTSTTSVLLPNLSYYSLSKEAMEELARKWAKDHDKPIVVVRPSTIVGVGEPNVHLIPTLIKSCIEGTVMPFVREPTHDFLDVGDFVSAVSLVASKAKELSGQVINIGSGTKTTNDQVRALVEAVTGRKAKVTIQDTLRPYDTPHWDIDTWHIRSLGWSPKKLLVDTIKEMVKAYGK